MGEKVLHRILPKNRILPEMRKDSPTMIIDSELRDAYLNLFKDMLPTEIVQYLVEFWFDFCGYEWTKEDVEVYNYFLELVSRITLEDVFTEGL